MPGSIQRERFKLASRDNMELDGAATLMSLLGDNSSRVKTKLEHAVAIPGPPRRQLPSMISLATGSSSLRSVKRLHHQSTAAATSSCAKGTYAKKVRIAARECEHVHATGKPNRVVGYWECLLSKLVRYALFQNRFLCLIAPIHASAL